MSHQYVRQPNGKIAVWSTIVEDFVELNASREEVILKLVDDLVSPAASPESIAIETARATKQVDELLAGKKPVQHWHTWETALAWIRCDHFDVNDKDDVATWSKDWIEQRQAAGRAKVAEYLKMITDDDAG